MTLRRKILFSSVALFLVIGLPLLLAELWLRFQGPLRVHGVTFSHPVLHHYHRPGWSAQIESFSDEYADFMVAYDADGCSHDPRSPPQTTGSEPNRIAFMGDSFVEAYQLPYSETFIASLQTSLKSRAWVRNYGVTSYSPVLSLLQWREITSKWKPTHVVHLIYANDIDRSTRISDADYLEKAVFSPQGELLAVPGSSNALEDTLRHFHLAWAAMRAYRGWQNRAASHSPASSSSPFLEPNPDIAGPTPDYILKLKAEVESTGARYFLCAVPSKERNLHPSGTSATDLEFSDKLKTWAQVHAVSFIDLAAVFRKHTQQGNILFFRDDIHFNKNGHLAAAEAFLQPLLSSLK